MARGSRGSRTTIPGPGRPRRTPQRRTRGHPRSAARTHSPTWLPGRWRPTYPTPVATVPGCTSRSTWTACAPSTPGGRSTAHRLPRQCCDGRPATPGSSPAVLGSAGQPLDVGRDTRTVPTGIRRALTLRDRGCSFPGCDRPPGWTDAHHIRHWADGGQTSLDNLVLLCRHHHRVTHHQPWTVTIGSDGHPCWQRPGSPHPEQCSRMSDVSDRGPMRWRRDRAVPGEYRRRRPLRPAPTSGPWRPRCNWCPRRWRPVSAPPG